MSTHRPRITQNIINPKLKTTQNIDPITKNHTITPLWPRKILQIPNITYWIINLPNPRTRPTITHIPKATHNIYTPIHNTSRHPSPRKQHRCPCFPPIYFWIINLHYSRKLGGTDKPTHTVNFTHKTHYGKT
ncbi:hypothetical protein [Candidatus Bathycorpusculum sp.]|uniref:hypothetical protein n=1 Tax=Candidatus Bathycorpusculum sp. TaxID=2994959 RepID=UPI002836B7FB|nr:hypothetical protein [Candidatus Termitimicrobium sp.]MCL2432578.1 hypothetical protein [Candidatus Termitimicrobium sp.]